MILKSTKLISLREEWHNFNTLKNRKPLFKNVEVSG